MTNVKGLVIELLAGRFAIHRLPANTPIPSELLAAAFVSITRTADELSIVSPQGLSPDGAKTEPDWVCFKARGPLEFGMTGVLASLSGALAAAGVSLFAVSTYDTDYILVKADKQNQARRALERAGCQLNFPTSGSGNADSLDV